MSTLEDEFEREFPRAFADSLKALVDGVALDRILDRLGHQVSERLRGVTVTIRRAGAPFGPPDIDADTLALASCTVRDVVVNGKRWGDLVAVWTDGDEHDSWLLDGVVEHAGWLVARHAARRRRLDAIDHERQLIAGRLHDDSIQAMTAISLNLQRLARTADVDREQVEQLLHLTNDAIDRLRHMMFSLHPPSLVDDGLVATLEEYLEGFIAPTGLRVAVHGDAGRRTTAATEALAFRLARGAIHNSWTHAEAQSIDVTVTVGDSTVEIVVSDDGIGFDPATIAHSNVGHAGIGYACELATS